MGKSPYARVDDMGHTDWVEEASSDLGRGADGARPVVVGRADEIAHLTDLADRSVEQRAQFVFVSGEAGVGKSTLINHVAHELAAARWAVHTGHCIEYAERTLPFDPIVPIIRSILDNLADDLDELVGHRRADLAALLPELRTDGVDGASLSGDVDRLIDAISTLLIRAADRRPMTLVVEDIQWADAATRDLLASLVHSLGTARILVVISERTAAVARGDAFHTWLAEFRRFANVTTIPLGGLSREALALQATRILGAAVEESELIELEERTGGNAYFVNELLWARRAGSTALPSSLADFITSRIQRLDRDEQEVVRAMAVAGRPIHHRLLAQLLPDLDVSGAIRRLFEASIVVADGSNLSFGHALLREAILPDVLPFESEDLHRRLAESTEANLGRNPAPGDLASAAIHWRAANEPEHAIAAAARAARAAADIAAYETAADLASMVLGLWDNVADPEDIVGATQNQLTVEASDWLVASNQTIAAADLLTEAIVSPVPSLADGRRALLLAKLAPIRFEMGRTAEADDLIESAVALVGDEISPEAAQVHHRASKLSLVKGSIHPAISAAERTIDIAQSTGPETVLVEAMMTRALGLGVTEKLDVGVALARDARRRAMSQNLVSQVAFSYRTEMMIINHQLGRTEANLEALRNGLAFANQHCGPSLRLDLTLDLALGLVEAGRLTEAAPLIADLLETPTLGLRGVVVVQTAALHALLSGDLDQASSFLASAEELSHQFHSAQETGFQLRLEAELARRRGNFDDALAFIDHALELQMSSDNITFTRESILEKCRLINAISRDDLPRALALRPEAQVLVDQMAAADRGTQALSTLMALELRLVDQSATLIEATAVLDQLPMFGFGADVLQATLIRAELTAEEPKMRDDVVDLLVDLRALGASSGMGWLSEGADRITEQLGVAIDLTEGPTPTLPAEEPDHGLTAREVEVLALLADGLTNKEIGAELYVSHRTISTHVSNLLAKLHLKNRSEAASAYHRLGFAEAKN